MKFERAENGDINVTHDDGRVEAIDRNHWYSIIAQVSYYGEEDYGFYRAMNFHDGTPIHSTCPIKEKPAREYPTFYDDGTCGTE